MRMKIDMNKVKKNIGVWLKNKKVLTALLILVVVLGGYTAIRQLLPNGKNADGAVYSTYEVKRGDLSVGVEATGSLNPGYGGSIQVPGNNYGDGSTAGSYVIQNVLVKEGDEVTAGQPIIQLNQPALKDQLKAAKEQLDAERESLASLLNVPVSKVDTIDPNQGIVMSAPITGRVMDLTLKAGEKITSGQIVATIVDDSRFEMTAKLTPGEINNLKDNYKAAVRFPAYFDGMIKGDIVEINRNAVPTSSKDLISDQGIPTSQVEGYEFVYWVTVAFDNPGLIRPGLIGNVGFYDPNAVSAKDDMLTLSAKAAWCRYLTSVDRYVQQEEILSRVDGIVTKVKAKQMATVAKGDPIIVMAGQDVREEIETRQESIREKRTALANLQAQEGSLTVVAPCDGVLSQLQKNQGATVSPGEWIGSVFQPSNMQMWTNIDETDILLVKQGAPVKVTLDALPGQEFSGTVETVAAAGKGDNGVTQFQVYITVVGSAQIKSGMQAKAYIGADSVQNVLLVPLEAIFYRG